MHSIDVGRRGVDLLDGDRLAHHPAIRPLVLDWHVDNALELLGPIEDGVLIAQQLARDRDDVGRATLEDVLGMGAARYQTDAVAQEHENGLTRSVASAQRKAEEDLRGDVDASAVLHTVLERPRELDLVVGADRDRLPDVVAARGRIDKDDATLDELLQEDLALLNIPTDPLAASILLALRVPLDGRDTSEQRLVLGERGPDKLDNLESEPHAILEGATVLVRAVVRERREEGLDKVAVREV
jgi:hypothetical protein